MKYNVEWLNRKIEAGETIKYVFFWGHRGDLTKEVGKFIFSQWHYSPFTVDGIVFKTAEHWMMAGKAKLFGDMESFNKIVEADKPGEVKSLGRSIMDFDQATWEGARFEIVKEGNIHKFGQHEILKKYLVNTDGRILVEASPVDEIWGIGMTADAENIENPNTWRGLNLLGFAMMEVRDFLIGNESKIK